MDIRYTGKNFSGMRKPQDTQELTQLDDKPLVNSGTNYSEITGIMGCAVQTGLELNGSTPSTVVLQNLYSLQFIVPETYTQYTVLSFL